MSGPEGLGPSVGEKGAWAKSQEKVGGCGVAEYTCRSPSAVQWQLPGRGERHRDAATSGTASANYLSGQRPSRCRLSWGGTPSQIYLVSFGGDVDGRPPRWVQMSLRIAKDSGSKSGLVCAGWRAVREIKWCDGAGSKPQTTASQGSECSEDYFDLEVMGDEEAFWGGRGGSLCVSCPSSARESPLSAPTVKKRAGGPSGLAILCIGPMGRSRNFGGEAACICPVSGHQSACTGTSAWGIGEGVLGVLGVFKMLPESCQTLPNAARCLQPCCMLSVFATAKGGGLTLTPPARPFASPSARPQPPRPKQHPIQFLLTDRNRPSPSGLSPISLLLSTLPSCPVQPERHRLRFIPSPSYFARGLPQGWFCLSLCPCGFATDSTWGVLQQPASLQLPALLAGSPTHLAEYRLASLDLLFTGSTASSTSAPFLHIILGLVVSTSLPECLAEALEEDRFCPGGSVLGA
ncbi:hypothetical protein AOQ84DRAFT_421499 [Glonium stellatum]|uniref:Uncharacterized protein n=1 Tax=Glonium stellatum TaxID=574774 RepID=A0A8E2F803_9PEZI|nr:hypothetical protein AOQ84DRAFT_421499 [Glonium stellatum]